MLRVEASLKELTRRARSESPANQLKAASIRSVPTRMSILPSVKLRGFHRPASNEQPPTILKNPLITLSLSSHSFLDSVIVDTTTDHHLYTFNSIGCATTITRTVGGSSAQFASIRWPKVLPTRVKGKEVTDGVSINMGNVRWRGGETLLKPGPTPESSRKFTIPNYPEPLKWKRRGGVYCCTTASVKGPIATMIPSKGRVPAQISVYETLHDKQDTRGLLNYRGVYLVLLDYLVVTSLLLVTDVQEWMLMRGSDGRSIAESSMLGSDQDATATNSQWRKIMYREPLFPKLSSETSSQLSGSDDEYDSANQFPPTPSSLQHPYRTSVYPSMGPHSRSAVSVNSLMPNEFDDDDVTQVAVRRRSLEPRRSQLHLTSPTSHSFIDMHPYQSRFDNLPPVPPLPFQYSQSNLNLREALPSSPMSSSFTPNRRQRDTPSSSLQQPPYTPPDSNEAPPTPSRISDSSPDSPMTRTRSMSNRTSRPLPSVPAGPVSILRRTRSQAVLTEDQGPSTSDHALTPPVPSRPRRSLPPTPMSNQPGSATSDVIQEELRAAAATVHLIRNQTQYTYTNPLPRLKDEDEAWMNALTQAHGPTNHDASASMDYDAPPPAYDSLFEAPKITPSAP